tara:strand:- start:586 stop:1095 length:510 start_codon:yes stop_codon:yes gene_type:complete
MVLNKENLESIRNKKITFVKGFTSSTTEYDFNTLSKLTDDYSLVVDSVAWDSKSLFKSIWQMKNIHVNQNYFFTFMDFFYKTFKYVPDVRDGVDLFFSFVTNVGASHVDDEDVFLISLRGISTYRITETNEDYQLESGDLLFIPKGVRHKAISTTPRIIASVGYYGGRS